MMHEESNEVSKTCTKCKVAKPAEAYYLKACKRKRMAQCRVCLREAKTARRLRDKKRTEAPS